MKIVQILPELNEGGVERGVIELNREMVNQGYESFVISDGGKLVKKVISDGGKHINLDVCSKNIITLPFRIRKLRKVLRMIGPDIVHARSRIPAWMVFFSRNLPFKFVTTIHGLNSVNFYSRIMTKGDRVIAVGEVVKKHVVMGYGINPDDISVIQRGVDLESFNPQNVDVDYVNKFKKKYELDSKFIITSVGRITWLKDYETLIRATALMNEELPQAVVIIVGSVRDDKQNYFKILKQMANELGVEKNIKFIGNQQNMAEIYFLSDVVVNLSLKMGNIGRTINESLAMNTPVIATTYDGLNNVIKDGVNGFLVRTSDPYDLSEKLKIINNKPFENVRSTINNEYTLQTMVCKTLDLYNQIKNNK